MKKSILFRIAVCIIAVTTVFSCFSGTAIAADDDPVPADGAVASASDTDVHTNFTLTYDTNGGTGKPDALTGNGPVKLSVAVPEKVGYYFLGWAKTAKAYKPEYSAGAIFTLVADITLYAVWTNVPIPEGDFVLIYNANGGTGEPKTQTGSGEIDIDSTAPTKEDGSEFLGWATTDRAVEGQYQPGDKFELKEDSTLYAIWGDNGQHSVIYTITFDANGGSNAPYKQTGVGDIVLTEAIPTRDGGYEFLGWAKSKTATAATWKAGDTYEGLKKDVTLYAVWKAPAKPVEPPTTYTLTYSANGGKNAPAAKTGRGSITLSTVKPTKEGFVFKGWAKSSSASKAEYNPGASFNLTSNVILYAVWETDPRFDIEIKKYQSTLSVPYNSKVILHTNIDEAPAGYKIRWSNGAEGNTCTIGKASEKQYRISASLVKETGSKDVIATTSEEVVNVSTNIFARIVAFVRGLFGRLPVFEDNARIK